VPAKPESFNLVPTRSAKRGSVYTGEVPQVPVAVLFLRLVVHKAADGVRNFGLLLGGERDCQARLLFFLLFLLLFLLVLMTILRPEATKNSTTREEGFSFPSSFSSPFFSSSSAFSSSYCGLCSNLKQQAASVFRRPTFGSDRVQKDCFVSGERAPLPEADAFSQCFQKDPQTFPVLLRTFFGPSKIAHSFTLSSREALPER
jgi:hypothetical protein